jgi:hypothetical protein
MGLCFVRACLIFPHLLYLEFLWSMFWVHHKAPHQPWFRLQLPALQQWHPSPSPFWSCTFIWPWVPPQPMYWATNHSKPFTFKHSPPSNALEESILDPKSLL